MADYKNDPLATVNLFDPSVFQEEGQKVSKGPYATQNQRGYDTPYAIDELNAFKSFARAMGYDPYEFMQQTEGAPQYNVPVSLFNLYKESRKAAAPQGTLGMTSSQLESLLRQAGEKAGPDYFAQEQARRQQEAINAEALIPRPSGIGGSPPLELFGAEYEAARQKSINDYLAQQEKARNDPLTIRTVNDPSDPFTSRSETTEEMLRRGVDPTGSSQQRRSGETPAGFYNTADYMEVDGKLVPRPGSGAPPISSGALSVDEKLVPRYSSTLEAIRQQAQERLAQGISEKDLRAYGQNIGLTPAEIDYVLGKTKNFAATEKNVSDLDKALEADKYITKLAGDLGDKNVSAAEQLALSDPEIRKFAENAFQRKNVDKISDTDLSSYAKAIGLNQDLTDYLLGKEMNLGTGYDIGSNVDSAVATEQAKQAAIKATGKDPTKMTTADYLAAILATPTVKGGTGTDTVKGGTGTDTVKGGTGTDTVKGGTGIGSLAGTKVIGSGGTKQLTLPEGWDNYTGDAKLKWFKDNNILVSDLQAAGVSAADINWMLQNGYTGTDTVKGGTGTDTVKGGTGTGTDYAYDDKIIYRDDIGKERVGRGVDVSGESGLREAYAPYVQRLLERASAEADVPFQKYTGESPLLESARAGIANLTTPAQFLQGSNLATAAGIGALEYGKYKPTTFTTGTFANPNFAAQSAAAPAEPVGADKVFYESFGRTPNQTELSNLRTYLQSTPDYAAYQKTLKPAAQGGVMSLAHYDVGGTVNVGGDDPTNPYTVPANPNIQPVNYGGQNVTNVQASYMSPYMQGVIDPAVREAKRQSDIMGQTAAAKAVGAGAFGGSRHGLVEAERQRNLATQLGDIQSKGLQEAYTQGLGQFNAEQARGLQAQQLSEQSRQFGATLGLQGLQTGIQAGTALSSIGQQQGMFDLNALKQMEDLGKEQRDFDYNEFLRGEKYPYQNLEFMKNIMGVVPGAALSPAAEGGSAIPGGTADAFSTFLQALQGMGKIIPGGASGGLISGIATLGD